MLRSEFRKLVLSVLADLPPQFRHRLENIDIIIKWRATPAERRLVGGGRGGDLFGLYLGHPLTVRGDHYNMALPDKIVIYQEPHERLCSSPEEMAEQVRRTVLHEIGHYLGIEENRLRELGMH
jgi:predicted Zn-dependent protease with MMP-like domain